MRMMQSHMHTKPTMSSVGILLEATCEGQGLAAGRFNPYGVASRTTWHVTHECITKNRVRWCAWLTHGVSTRRPALHLDPQATAGGAGSSGREKEWRAYLTQRIDTRVAARCRERVPEATIEHGRRGSQAAARGGCSDARNRSINTLSKTHPPLQCRAVLAWRSSQSRGPLCS